jgi:HptB-dependent secretion and biofilm anti anti-sigma factor
VNSLDVRRDKDQLAVGLHGRFDFAIYPEFRRLFGELDRARTVTIDMSDVDYMDSAALGMLLLLEQRVPRGGSRIRLLGAQGQPRDVLEIAAFSQYFDIV